MTRVASFLHRRSRTLFDLILMGCMADLPQEGVTTALDLSLARLEALLRAGAGRVAARVLQGVQVPGQSASSSMRRIRALWPLLALIAWYWMALSTATASVAVLVYLGLGLRRR